jgi:hypothetical protein
MCPDPFNPAVDVIAAVVGFDLLLFQQWFLLVGFLFICLLCWIFCGRVAFGFMGMMFYSSRWEEWRNGKIVWYKGSV